MRQHGGVSVVVSGVMWSGRVKAMLLEGKSIAFEVQKGCFWLAKSMLLEEVTKPLCSKEIERGDNE